MDAGECESLIRETRHTVEDARRLVTELADLCGGQLKKAGVCHQTLEELKRELRNYNIHTGLWKDER